MGGISTDIAVHPSNKFVYVTTSDTDYVGMTGKSNSVSAFSVASNGSLVTVPGSPFLTSGPNWGIAIDPSGQYLYASSQVSDSNESGQSNAFSINQTTGTLTPIPGSPFPIIPYTCPVCFGDAPVYGLTIDPTGNFLIGGSELNGVMYVYRIEAGTGSISEVAGSPFVEQTPSCAGVGSCFPGAAITDVTVTPDDQYVFVSNQYGVNGLGMYDFDSSTGALSNLTWSPSPYNTWSTTSAVVRSDPSGKFVYTLGNVGSKRARYDRIRHRLQWKHVDCAECALSGPRGGVIPARHQRRRRNCGYAVKRLVLLIPPSPRSRRQGGIFRTLLISPRIPYLDKSRRRQPTPSFASSPGHLRRAEVRISPRNSSGAMIRRTCDAIPPIQRRDSRP